jgi:hypothetical protein
MWRSAPFASALFLEELLEGKMLLNVRQPVPRPRKSRLNVGGRFKTGQLWSNQNQPLLLFKSKEGVLASSD